MDCDSRLATKPVTLKKVIADDNGGPSSIKIQIAKPLPQKKLGHCLRQAGALVVVGPINLNLAHTLTWLIDFRFYVISPLG